MEANDSHSYDADLLLGPAAGDMDTARQLQECALVGYEQAASMLPDSWEVQYHLALHFFSIRKVDIPALCIVCQVDPWADEGIACGVGSVGQQLSRAVKHAKAAVALNKSADAAWHVLAVLATAQRGILGPSAKRVPYSRPLTTVIPEHRDLYDADMTAALNYCREALACNGRNLAYVAHPLSQRARSLYQPCVWWQYRITRTG